MSTFTAIQQLLPRPPPLHHLHQYTMSQSSALDALAETDPRARMARDLLNMYLREHNRAATRPLPWSVPDSDVATDRPGFCPQEEMMVFASFSAKLSLEAEYRRIKEYLAAHPRPRQDNGSPLMRFPPLPAFVREVEEIYLFGWRVTGDWLRTFSSALLDADMSRERTDAPHIARLRHRSGFADIRGCLGIHPYSRPALEHDPEGEIPFVELLAVCNTSSELEYSVKRPTEAQYEWLNGLFADEGQWFRSVVTKEEWDENTREVMEGTPLTKWLETL